MGGAPLLETYVHTYTWYVSKHATRLAKTQKTFSFTHLDRATHGRHHERQQAGAIVMPCDAMLTSPPAGKSTTTTTTATTNKRDAPHFSDNKTYVAAEEYVPLRPHLGQTIHASFTVYILPGQVDSRFCTG